METYIRLTNYKSSDKKQKIDNRIHLGARTFEESGGEVVQSVAFVLVKAE